MMRDALPYRAGARGRLAHRDAGRWGGARVAVVADRTAVERLHRDGWTVVGALKATRYARRPNGNAPPAQPRAADGSLAMLEAHRDGSAFPHARISTGPSPTAFARLYAPAHPANFYARRYGDRAPAHRFVLVGRARLDAFVALRAVPGGGRSEVHVVVWRACSERHRALALEAALALGDFDRMSLWSSRFSPGESAVLGRLGFERRRPRGGTSKP